MTVTDATAFPGAQRWPESSPLSSDDTISGRIIDARHLFVPPHAAEDWAHEVKSELNELLLLREGWDGGVAAPVSARAVDVAKQIVDQAAELIPGLRRPSVTPAVDGAVVLEWHRDSAHIEISFGDERAEVFYESEDTGDEWEGEFENAPVNPAVFLHLHFR